MKQKVQEKQEAIRLRKLGYSYKDILSQLDVAKSSLSGWLKHLDLNEEQISLLKSRMLVGRDRGRFNSIITNRNKRITREESVFESAKAVFDKYKVDPFFTLGIALYWAEGTKKCSNFQFINSDPNMVKLMLRWAQSFLEILKEQVKIRLFIHSAYSHENHESFWSKTLDIPEAVFQKTIYKPTIHKVKKNPSYKGCLRLSLGGIDELRKMVAWQKLLVAYYESV